MAIVANNIANASTPGYCADRVVIGGAAASRASGAPNPENASARFPDLLYASIEKQVTDFTPGMARETGLSTDLLIDGDGFFAVQTPWGERYTRQGNLRLDSEGRLATVDGNPVLGINGQPIEIATARFTVRPGGEITDAQGQEVGAVRLVEFPDPRWVLKEGNGLFRVTSPEGAPVAANPETVSVRQGFLASSNVQIVNELVTMIGIERAYQSFFKVMQTVDGLDGQMIAASSE
jgi:flagellar basal-body rod protein FlgG